MNGNGEEAHFTLIDRLLAEQRDLSAVEQFSARHTRGNLPALERHYRTLLPAAPPGLDEQYAFSVDLDGCSGCKACVSACHSLNGLDKEEEETWRSVGLLHGESGEGIDLSPFQQTITTACHHCVEPGCLTGCPVLAYEKDARTGIVRQLDDQCIGCQYCVLKCPYDVPQYSPKRGIVRKCDMCSERLAVNEAPACVQACPNGAITITVIRKEEAVSAAQRGEFLPGTPDPLLTVPTTRYLSRRDDVTTATLRPADEHLLLPAPGHPPLVAMLVLTQFSVGLFLVEAALRFFAPPTPGNQGLRAGLVFLAAAVGLAGIGTSVLHLGRPLGAWRAFLGLRTSWLSREIVAFGLFAGLVFLHLALVVLEPLALGRLPSTVVDPVFHAVSAAWGPETALRMLDFIGGTIVHVSGGGVVTFSLVATGLLAVGTSVMIYADTGREVWTVNRTAFRFYGTVLLLGAACAAPFFLRDGVAMGLFHGMLGLLMGLSVVKIGLEAALFAGPAFAVAEKGQEFKPAWTPTRKAALLLLGPLLDVFRLRCLAGLIGGFVLPYIVITHVAEPRMALAVSGVAALFVLIGEVCERYLFFATAAVRKMPGHFNR